MELLGVDPKGADWVDRLPRAEDTALREFIDDQFFKRFWFLRENRRETQVFCEACGTRTMLQHPKYPVPKAHKDYTCPFCRSTGEARNMRLSRKDLYEDGFVTWWYRATSPDETETAFSVTYYVLRDYSEEAWSDETDSALLPWNVETVIKPYAVCAFSADRQIALRWERKSVACKEGPYGPWQTRGECTSPVGHVFGRQAMFGHPYFHAYSEDNLKNALSGTRIGAVLALVEEHIPEALSTEERSNEYATPDRITEIANIVRRPQIEYLLKLDCDDLAARGLHGQSLSPYLNWRGKTAEKVLKIPAQDIRAARRARCEITLDYLKTHRFLRERGLRWTPEEIARFSIRLAYSSEYHIREIEELFRRDRLRRVYRYILRQESAHAISDCLDYWRDCVRLGRDMRDERAVFPRDLPARHAEDQQRIRHLADADLEALLAERLTELDRRFTFLYRGILLRPARSGAEVIAEGEALHHCVGGYVRRYATGGTVICVMRVLGELGKPWRTVELTPAGNLVQCRGDRNDMSDKGNTITPELQKLLDEFWAAFAAWQKDIVGKAA